MGLVKIFVVGLLGVLGASELDWVLGLGGRVERDESGRCTGIVLRGTWVTDADLDSLQSLPYLSRLNLAHTRITDQGMLRLKGLREIVELDLYYAEQLTDEGLAAIKDWKRLERLILRGTKITDTTLVMLSGIPSIKALDISYAQVTDTGLQQLAPLSGLRELAFGGNKLTERALEVLNSLPGLTHLEVAGRQRTDSGLWSVSVTDLGIDPIGTLHELRELNLSGTQISARGLEKLSRLAKLEKLDLHGAKRIGDDAIAHLKALPRLRWVDLKDTGVTSAGSETLRSAMPQCTILWE
jgi:Leucine-rich repeat (LRR) protein